MVLGVSLAIILISLLVLFPNFYVGLYGDDWLAIFRYIVHVAPPSKEGWNLFTYYLTPYGSQDIIMGLLYQNFGTNAFYYEITSYTFRLIAAFSLYPIVFYLTRSKLATFFAILFFSVTTTGFDSTGWLLTMPTYLTIAFFNIFLYFYILSRKTRKIKLLALSGLFYYAAYVTASARMLGAPLFILSMEIYWLFKDRTISSLKYSFLRIALFLTIFIIIGLSGHSLGNSSDWFQRLSSSISTIRQLLNEGRSDFFIYPILTIGGMIVPNFAFPSIQINTKSDMLFSVALPILFLLLFFLLVIKANIAGFKKSDIYKTLFAGTVWILLIFVIRKLNIITFSSSNLILMTAIGGITIIIWILLSIRYRAKESILDVFFISFSWTLLSFFLAWLWNPSSYIDSTHRYLTLSAVGISIFFAAIISLGKKFKNQLCITLLFSSLLVLHIVSTRTYINKLLNSHSQQTVDRIWSSIPYIPGVGKEPIILYFERDNTNASILGDSVMFGFPFHIALLYNLKEGDKIPASMENWQDVVSTVTLEPVPINNVYAFHLQGQDNLINITEEARQKLAEEK